MSKHYLNGEVYTIENFKQSNPFANFLPGVAGKEGIPLWVFYVNRGQGVAGFGIDNKKRPIMPFTPANKAYETVSTTGFRTFMKVNGTFYEAFASDTLYPHSMNVERTAFSIEEINTELNLKITVRYFGLAEAPIGALVREVSIENLSGQTLEIELVDGLAEIVPSRVANDDFKRTSNLLASWMDVKHLDENIGFYVLRGATGDTAEVNSYTDGNFYVGFDRSGLLPVMADGRTIFGQNTAKSKPEAFLNFDWQTFTSQKQIPANKIPCAFVPIKTTIHKEETLTFYALSGYASCIDTLKRLLPTYVCFETMKTKRHRAKEIVETLLEDVTTKTALPLFDAYIKQNYLDNFLRGGYPVTIADKIYHLYSRRHGDLERDYNFFSLLPEYYSQGSGNFRDVCQNRRLDGFFEPEVKDFNIKMFANLIQLDGYNPLTVYGVTYCIRNNQDLQLMIDKHFPKGAETLVSFVEKPFTPGGFIRHVFDQRYQPVTSIESYINDFLSIAEIEFQAGFGEGFWIDHFTYLLDLLESYESIFPDGIETLLFDDETYRYYDSAVTLLKKDQKTVLNNQGNVRQYNSLMHFDEEKVDRFKMNPYATNWVKEGEEFFTTNLFVKMFIIVLNKHSQLDPDGFGIEMEAEKPGWNDAMNGMPGLFGSGVSETIELLRIVEFLKNRCFNHNLSLPKCVHEFYRALQEDSCYLSRVKARETYREAIRFGIENDRVIAPMASIEKYLNQLTMTLNKSLEYLYETYQGIPPTFLHYQVTEHEPIENGAKNKKNGYTLVHPIKYQRHALPPFLEAPARLLKTSFDKDKLATMHRLVLSSELYDTSLKMFKTSASLDHESHEIGRIQAFNKGWLERESNFLHMTYKYLLGLLKAGLYEEYYRVLEDNLVCFQDAKVYGRSILENSSFIATTNNPDTFVHGQGFFARLSGSTVEVLNMWAIMMTGGQPFTFDDGELKFALTPKLDKKYFNEDKQVTFTFLKTIEVTYVNESLEHTFNRCDIDGYELIKGGVKERYNTRTLSGEIAQKIRNRLYDKMIVYMNKKKK